jgi:hypothetical protein
VRASSSRGGISGQSLAAALDGVAHPTEMDAGVAVSNFFGDLGDRCGCKGGTMPGSGDSVRLSLSSPRGTCGGGGAH